jgi:hypothetical protein
LEAVPVLHSNAVVDVHVDVPHTSTASATVSVWYRKPKFSPAITETAPPVRGTFGETVLTTGASKVTTRCPLPTAREMVTAVELSPANRELLLQRRFVRVTQDVQVHGLAASEVVGVRSALAKFMPSKLSEACPVCGVFLSAYDSTGASQVYNKPAVATIMLTLTELCRPGTAEKVVRYPTEVEDVHNEVAQRTRAFAKVAV